MGLLFSCKQRSEPIELYKPIKVAMRPVPSCFCGRRRRFPSALTGRSVSLFNN